MVYEQRLMDLTLELNDGLNPCFCGRWFMRIHQICGHKKTMCLNPCFCGRWFMRQIGTYVPIENEFGLNPCFCGRWFMRGNFVIFCFLVVYSSKKEVFLL